MRSVRRAEQSWVPGGRAVPCAARPPRPLIARASIRDKLRFVVHAQRAIALPNFSCSSDLHDLQRNEKARTTCLGRRS